MIVTFIVCCADSVDCDIFVVCRARAMFSEAHKFDNDLNDGSFAVPDAK